MKYGLILTLALLSACTINMTPSEPAAIHQESHNHPLSDDDMGLIAIDRC